MKKRILWVEDISERFMRNSLTLKLYLRDHGIDAEIDHAETPAEATFRVVSEGQPYDLVLMDLDLGTGHQGDWVSQAMIQKAPGTRIIVISSHVGDALFAPRLEKLVRSRAILGSYDVVDSMKWKKAVYHSLQVETPRILHLADFRCAVPAQGKIPWTPWNEAREYLRQVTRRLSPNVLIVSGGLTERGTWPEFRNAADFLRSLRDDGPGRADRLIVVPGPSDVLPQATSPVLAWKNYARFVLEEAGSKETLPGLPGLDQVTANGTDRDVDWEQRYFYVMHVDDTLRMVVVGFNSVAGGTEPSESLIQALQLDEVTQRLGKLPKRCALYLKVAVLAHPLIGALPGAGTASRDALANVDQLVHLLTAHGFDLVLHSGVTGPNAYMLHPLLISGGGPGKPFVVAGAGRHAPNENTPVRISLNLVEGQFTDWDVFKGLKISSFTWSPEGESVSDVEYEVTRNGTTIKTHRRSHDANYPLEED